ncbi:hypothetical protein C448_11836 [Halococcus morrhuae DSM 1307]|uniref:Uncharacterized protein n=1 Tax=Halococcus morrhuae DSM 1307 TaxID=931277 RepID=M0MCT7_HALMO|nr:hypothetical protein [Halococcus morrhuae]EMA42220.1 hypothetical protein C448_11836 [Halococcus morrhuae DSM 1307]
MPDDTPTARRTVPQTDDGSRIGHPLPDYHVYSDDRLRQCCRRNSRLLREYGPDWRTIRTLCAVEERLRARDIDPIEIVAELNDD